MLPPELTIENILKGTIEFLVGFARMIWVSLIQPYPWFWLVVAVVLVLVRVLPTMRRR